MMIKYVLISVMFFTCMEASIGKVRALRGEAKIYRDGTVIAVKKMQDIFEKDKIITQKRSRIQVILDDDTVITIGSDSDYTFDSFSEKKQEVKMHLKKGLFRIVTGKIGKLRHSGFKVKTNNSTIGIRGTQFMASVIGDKEEIACIQGEITVSWEDRRVDVPAGNMAELQVSKTWKVKRIAMAKFSKVMPATGNLESSDSKEEEAVENVAQTFDEANIDEGEGVLDDYLLDEITTGTDPFGLILNVDNTTSIPAF